MTWKDNRKLNISVSISLTLEPERKQEVLPCAGPAPNPGGSRGVLMLAWGPVSLSLYLRSEHRLSRFPQTRRGRRGPGWGHGADSAASRSVAGLPKLSALLGLGPFTPLPLITDWARPPKPLSKAFSLTSWRSSSDPYHLSP